MSGNVIVDGPGKQKVAAVHEPVREKIKGLALQESEPSPRELAMRFTDAEKYPRPLSLGPMAFQWLDVRGFRVSHPEILRPDHQPAFVVVSAADECQDKTTQPNQLWQTDILYLKVIGWGWFYLSTFRDDYSRYIIAWKLCTTMKAGDVTGTLDLALRASGCDQAAVRHKPRLLSGNGSSCISAELGERLED